MEFHLILLVPCTVPASFIFYTEVDRFLFNRLKLGMINDGKIENRCQVLFCSLAVYTFQRFFALSFIFCVVVKLILRVLSSVFGELEFVYSVNLSVSFGDNFIFSQSDEVFKVFSFVSLFNLQWKLMLFTCKL